MLPHFRKSFLRSASSGGGGSGAEGDPVLAKTVLLAHMEGANGSTAIVDEMGHLLTGFGGAAITNQAGKFGSSLNLTSPGRYVETEESADFELPGDFTIEGWFRQSTRASYVSLLHHKTYGQAGDGNFVISINDNGTRFGWVSYNGYYSNGAASAENALNGAATMALNNWNHFAVTRKGTMLRGFVNGAKVFEGTETKLINAGGKALRIGGAAFGYSELLGFMDEVRIVKGKALYTANFTPATSPLTAVTDRATALLFHMDGPNGGSVLTDSSSYNTPMSTGGSSSLLTTAAKFGTTGFNLAPGTTSAASSNSPQMTLGADDFTIEGWLKSPGITGSQWRMIMSVDGPNPDQFGALQFNATGLYVSTDGASWLNGAATGINVGTIHDNTWRHLAFVRHGTSLKVYNQGLMVGEANIGTAAIYARQPGLVTFGTGVSVGSHACHLDEWRFSKIARYKADFPPPTAPFAA